MTWRAKLAAASWWQKMIAGIGVAIGASWMITTALGVKIGYDDQDETCLDFRWSIVRRNPGHRFTAGEIVSFDPATVAPGVFPKGKYLGKKVVGVPGDRIDVSADGVMINGIVISRDFSVKSYPPKFQSVTIPADHYFVIGTAPGSFDSRYYGLVPQTAVYGTVIPIL